VETTLCARKPDFRGTSISDFFNNICAFRPKTRVASGPTPAIWSPIQSGIKLGFHVPESLKSGE